MSGLIPSLPFEPSASARAPKHRDTSRTCRDRATADLLKSIVTTTANERLTLERSAANWELRAQLLDRVEETERARAQMASHGLRA
jgi:hypothetical protein